MSSSKTPTVLVTALITFIVTSALWLGLGGLAYFMMQRDPSAFDVKVDHPETMVIGEKCTLTVTVGNSSSWNLQLGSIDVYEDLLEGFKVLSVTPRPDAKDDNTEFHSYYFNETIIPSDSFTFELELEAAKAGTWYGDIDCCTPDEDFVTSSAEIVITEPEAP